MKSLSVKFQIFFHQFFKEATKVTRMTQNVSTRGARRGAGRSNFGATRRNNQRNENFANR